LLEIGAPTFGKSSGLIRRYPSCAVDAYAEGEYVAFIPWETLKQFLAPEGQRIFGGTRPRSDEDDQR